MKLHHSKHHATYVNNLNAAEEQLTQALANGVRLYNLLKIREPNIMELHIHICYTKYFYHYQKPLKL